LPANPHSDSLNGDSPAEENLFVVDSVRAGMRLDRYLADLYPDLSRSRLSGYIRSGLVLVNSGRVKAGYRLRAGDRIRVRQPAPLPEEPEACPMDLQVIHEDDLLLVLNKPPGLVVHPGAGHAGQTLVNGLLHHCASLPGQDRQRPGIVHRLDKDTSGVMLVAKTEQAMQRLGRAFSDRKVAKTYLAVLLRTPRETQGRITAPIGRHPVRRQKMAVLPQRGRFAATNWKVVERYGNGMCLAEIAIETGRTHQIRVHMSHLGAPVAGDLLYGGNVPQEKGLPIHRQLLHASVIAFPHPAGTGLVRFSAPLWPDMEEVIDRLRNNRGPK